MAEKAKNNNKLILGICAAVAVIVVIVVAVVLATKGAGNPAAVSDSYFVSDDTKYVLTLDTDYIDDEEEYAPLKSHVVYYYSGDKITGMRTYYEYANDADAKAAYEAIKALGELNEANLSLGGKYVAITSTEDEYADLTASDVKQQIEFMEMLQNMNLNDSTEEVEEVEDYEEEYDEEDFDDEEDF